MKREEHDFTSLTNRTGDLRDSKTTFLYLQPGLLETVI